MDSTCLVFLVGLYSSHFCSKNQLGLDVFDQNSFSCIEQTKEYVFYLFQILIEHFPWFQEIFRCGNLLSYGLHIMNT